MSVDTILWAIGLSLLVLLGCVVWALVDTDWHPRHEHRWHPTARPVGIYAVEEHCEDCPITRTRILDEATEWPEGSWKPKEIR